LAVWKSSAVGYRAAVWQFEQNRARACVALARKLAGILYALWRDETEFDPQALRHSDAAAVV